MLCEIDIDQPFTEEESTRTHPQAETLTRWKENQNSCPTDYFFLQLDDWQTSSELDAILKQYPEQNTKRLENTIITLLLYCLLF